MIDETQIPDAVSRQLFLLTGWIDKDCRLAIKAIIDAWPNVMQEKHLAVRDDGEGYCLVPTSNLILPLKVSND